MPPTMRMIPRIRALRIPAPVPRRVDAIYRLQGAVQIAPKHIPPRLASIPGTSAPDTLALVRRVWIAPIVTFACLAALGVPARAPAAVRVHRTSASGSTITIAAVGDTMLGN